MNKFQTGERVALSRAFLKSTGQITGDAPFLRGTVQSCEPMAKLQLCYVLWDGREKAQGVLSSNLTALDRKHLELV